MAFRHLDSGKPWPVNCGSPGFTNQFGKPIISNCSTVRLRTWGIVYWIGESPFSSCASLGLAKYLQPYWFHEEKLRKRFRWQRVVAKLHLFIMSFLPQCLFILHFLCFWLFNKLLILILIILIMNMRELSKPFQLSQFPYPCLQA